VAVTGGQTIVSDTWEVLTSDQIDSWEVTSIDPTTCQKQTLSKKDGDFPACGAWKQSSGTWVMECTVSVSGVEAVVDIASNLNSMNQLMQLQENTTVSGSLLTAETIKITSQQSTPPPDSDFNLPAICNASLKHNRMVASRDQTFSVGALLSNFVDEIKYHVQRRN